VLLGAATTLLVAVSVPAAASTQPDDISISSVSFANTSPAVLTVTVDDSNTTQTGPAQITSLTVYFCAASVSACSDTTDPTLSLPVSPTAQPDSSGQTTIPVTIPEGSPPDGLPPGTYSLGFDATDSTGETDTGLTAQDQADLAFIYTGVAVTATATPISYGNTTETISGTVTGLPPGGSTAQGLGSVPVDLDDLSASTTTQIATTTATGTFTAQVTLTPADQYDVQVPEGQSWGSASISLPTSVDQYLTSVSAAVTPENFIYGSSVKATLTGTASYESGGSSHPLKHYEIQVTTGDKVDNLETNAKGQFSLTYPPSDGAKWTVSVGGGVLLAPSVASGSIHVAVPLSFRWFFAKLSTDGNLTASGCLDVTVPGFSPPGGRVDIQYEVGRSGPWRLLTKGQLTASGGPSCRGRDQSYFTAMHHVTPSNAYYRAYVPATVNYLSAVSHTLYRWKYITGIFPLASSPSAVAKAGKITFSGRLKVYLNGWRDYGNQKVWIIILRPGNTEWNPLTKNIATSARGQFKATIRAPGGWPNGGKVSVYYPGNTTHFASAGTLFCIRVSGAPDRCPKHAPTAVVTVS
jgi:hypothetical protein